MIVHQDIRLLGQLDHGIYVDECSGIHPDVINEFYGTDGQVYERAEGETGAGQLSDEEIPQLIETGIEMQESDFNELEEYIEEAHKAKFDVENVSCPRHQSPFKTDDLEIVFSTAFEQVRNLNLIPSGYGLLPEEWEDMAYPSYEVIKMRHGKELWIALPDFIWRARAELWGQALDIIDRLVFLQDGSD